VEKNKNDDNENKNEELSYMRPVHFEIHASDLQRCKNFYEQIFQWRIVKWESGATATEYWVVYTGPKKDEKNDDKNKDKKEPYSGIDGGMLLRKGNPPSENTPINGYVLTIYVQNIDELIQRVSDNGGSIHTPKFAIPPMGWICYCKDTEGNVFGMMQTDPNAK